MPKYIEVMLKPLYDKEAVSCCFCYWISLLREIIILPGSFNNVLYDIRGAFQKHLWALKSKSS